MPFNLLLLPLLGGFLLVSSFYITKYQTWRADGHRLLFYSATFGIGLLGISSFLAETFQALIGANWLDLWHKIAPYQYSGRATLSLILGLIGGYILNFLLWILSLSKVDDQFAIDRAIEQKKDPLELFFRKALGQGDQVMITLKSGKVYTGLIMSNLNPAFKMEAVRLLPSKSGYRDEKRSVIFTHDYSLPMEEIQKKIKEVRDWEERTKEDMGWWLRPKIAKTAKSKIAKISGNGLGIIIPISEVSSTSLYNPLYDSVTKLDETNGTNVPHKNLEGQQILDSAVAE
jgi:hypothetical protein